MTLQAFKLSTAALVLLAMSGVAQAQTEALKKGFENPPESAKPQVWWHWMNGNISKEGIQLDLEWMKRSGLGGFHNFDAALATPQVVDKRLAYMTPEWKDAFKYAIQTADRLGLKAAIAGSPGWSESGGPWVSGPEAMKKYVWSQIEIEGGKNFSGQLPHPPANTGAFQNAPIHDALGSPEGMAKLPDFYADIAVIAYRKSAADLTAASLKPVMSASGGSPEYALLADGDVVKTTNLPIPEQGKSAWIQWAFEKPQSMRSLTVVLEAPTGFAAMMGGGAPQLALESSDDGVKFTKATDLKGGDSIEQTYSFAPVTAKYFRVSFTHAPPPPLPDWAGDISADDFGFAAPQKATDYKIAELDLRPAARVHLFEDKAAFSSASGTSNMVTPAADAASIVKKSDVIDLTSKMKADGTLEWSAPEGNWVVVRFGYSLLGILNHPATAEATGLEVDKLSAKHVRKYFNTYLDSYKATVGADLMGKKGISAVINDSWEAGSENWTEDMAAQFQKLRGYDIKPWMPVLTGQIVESAEASDRFLWDFRKTIADLLSTEHYKVLEDVLHERGMIHYGESHEAGRAYVCDGMEVKKYNEVPMAAMWTQVPGMYNEQFGYNADDREAASTAHIYGQNLAAAESMTAAAAPWAWSPATLRPTLDQELINGINRVVIHESAHQPLIGKAPGLTLGPFGQWFNRNETWADQAQAWIRYIARSSYMLQQGRFAADVAYFYGEDDNVTSLFAHASPVVPAGYGWDFINADAVKNELSTKAGELTTKAGMSYKLLALDANARSMSLPVLEAIYKLVSEGGVVAGDKPAKDASQADDADRFAKLANELFGDSSGSHKVGKGTVYAGFTAEQALKAMAVKADFDFTRPAADTELRFVHRKLAEGEIYFVDNRHDRNEKLEASFRVSGKVPELWHADTGRSEAVSYKSADGITSIPLELEPWGSIFVVFTKDTKEATKTLPAKISSQVASLDNDWNLSFEAGRGAPASVKVDKLFAWDTSTDAGIKYFSGVGTYSKSIEVNAEWIAKGSELWLDLGEVKNLAEVSVNGKPLEVVWHAPYRVNLTPALKAGKNELSVKVVNSWVNRLIGDQQPGAEKITFTTVKPYKASSKLLTSGLIGPVKLETVK